MKQKFRLKCNKETWVQFLKVKQCFKKIASHCIKVFAKRRKNSRKLFFKVPFWSSRQDLKDSEAANQCQCWPWISFSFVVKRSFTVIEMIAATLKGELVMIKKTGLLKTIIPQNHKICSTRIKTCNFFFFGFQLNSWLKWNLHSFGSWWKWGG